jgi:hypothetical protein
MGNDEHGPAYPEPPKVWDHPDWQRKQPYRCPICNGDENRYMTCEYPGCPDGRDPGHPHARLFKRYEPVSDLCSKPSGPLSRLATAGIWLIGLTLLFYLFTIQHAPAMDHGFNPNNPTVQWFESLVRPDYPGSCCGKADAYPVESYWPNPDGTWTAKIGDGSAKKFPDGTTRDPIPNGYEVIVPKAVVNKAEDDLGNLTDVSWIFMTVHGGEPGTIYCLVRHPSGN